MVNWFYTPGSQARLGHDAVRTVNDLWWVYIMGSLANFSIAAALEPQVQTSLSEWAGQLLVNVALTMEKVKVLLSYGWSF